MTKEEQRIAIAEACGWIDIYRSAAPKPLEYSKFFGSRKEHRNISLPIPDYCNSLDAMHEAEKVFDPQQYLRYYSFLKHHVLGLIQTDSMERVVSSTASQRAEAFLKCLNLWKPRTIQKYAIDRDSKDEDCGHLNKGSSLPSKDTKKEGGRE